MPKAVQAQPTTAAGEAVADEMDMTIESMRGHGGLSLPSFQK
jgi:hypothetical protein